MAALSSNGYCYTSLSLRIYERLMNITGKVYNAAQATVQLSFKPTIDNTDFCRHIYIHTYLLHDYMLIANALGNYKAN